jgi:hypothetical protein
VATQQTAKLSRQAALRALDHQERAVEQLRARTGVLLGASCLIASVFGSEAMRRSENVGLAGALALTALVASVGLCVYILASKRDLTFGLDAMHVYERLPHVEDVAVNEIVIVWLTAFARENEDTIAALDRAYLTAGLCLLLQLGAWALPLIARIG